MIDDEKMDFYANIFLLALCLIGILCIGNYIYCLGQTYQFNKDNMNLGNAVCGYGWNLTAPGINIYQNYSYAYKIVFNCTNGINNKYVEYYLNHSHDVKQSWKVGYCIDGFCNASYLDFDNEILPASYHVHRSAEDYYLDYVEEYIDEIGAYNECSKNMFCSVKRFIMGSLK